MAFSTLPIEILTLTLQILERVWVIRERAPYIFADPMLIQRVCDILVTKLEIHPFIMTVLLPLTSAQHAPDLASETGWNTI